MVETIFSGVWGQTTLIFVLVFTLVYAVLQKTKILGDGKKQIDALIALAIGLLVISVGYALDIIQKLIPFLVVSLVILLVLLLLLGALYKEGEFKVDTWLKVGLGILIFIAVVIAVLAATGGWEIISNWVARQQGGSLIGNVVLVIVVLGAAAMLFFGSSKSSKKEDKG